jgi:NAD(P)-dependent dehydrogenase (short-subunit alcohol dehydrogenase family)
MPIADFGLKGRVAVVTGASRGIGEAIARSLAEQGANLVIAARKQESLEGVASAIRKDSGVKCVPVACHTGDPNAIGALFAKVESEFGRCDVLVNNAATNPYFGPAVNMELPAFDKTFEVNVRGYFVMSQHAARMMVKQGKGSIVNVASIAGISPGAMQCAYSMTKAAVINMTKAFAKELGSSNVRVNAICPGVVETKFASVLINTPEIYDQFITQIPLARHAQPSEMAGLAVYLASDASSYTTGGVFVSDGGMTA